MWLPVLVILIIAVVLLFNRKESYANLGENYNTGTDYSREKGYCIPISEKKGYHGKYKGRMMIYQCRELCDRDPRCTGFDYEYPAGCGNQVKCYLHNIDGLKGAIWGPRPEKVVDRNVWCEIKK